MVHEFGHMFGTLQDEYVYRNHSPFVLRKMANNDRNCALIEGVRVSGGPGGIPKFSVSSKAAIENWKGSDINRWKDIEGYDGEPRLGCTIEYAVRSSEYSIMRGASRVPGDTWANSWLPVNEHYLKQELAKYKGAPLIETKPVIKEEVPEDKPNIPRRVPTERNIPREIGGGAFGGGGNR
jgi:hypothetical protein